MHRTPSNPPKVRCGANSAPQPVVATASRGDSPRWNPARREAGSGHCLAKAVPEQRDRTRLHSTSSRASIEENLCSRGHPSPPDTRRGAHRGRDLSALGGEHSAGPGIRPWRKKRTDVELPPLGRALTGRKVPRMFCSEIPALSIGMGLFFGGGEIKPSIPNPRSTTSLKKQPWIAPPPRSVRVGTSCRAGMMLIRARCWGSRHSCLLFRVDSCSFCYIRSQLSFITLDSWPGHSLWSKQTRGAIENQAG